MLAMYARGPHGDIVSVPLYCISFKHAGASRSPVFTTATYIWGITMTKIPANMLWQPSIYTEDRSQQSNWLVVPPSGTVIAGDGTCALTFKEHVEYWDSGDDSGTDVNYEDVSDGSDADNSISPPTASPGQL